MIKRSLIINCYQRLDLLPEILEFRRYEMRSDRAEHMPVAQKDPALWIHDP